jgi:arylsulfatase A-like enzyme
VPLIIYTNGLYKERRTWVLTGQISIAPTILSILNISRPSSFIGRSAFEAIEGGDEYRNVISECSHTWKSSKLDRDHLQYAIRTKRWRLILHYRIGKISLYDVNEDQDELNNIIEGNPGIVDALRSQLDRHIQFEMGTIRNSLQIPSHDESVVNRLKALGYI